MCFVYHEVNAFFPLKSACKQGAPQSDNAPICKRLDEWGLLRLSRIIRIILSCPQNG